MIPLEGACCFWLMKGRDRKVRSNWFVWKPNRIDSFPISEPMARKFSVVQWRTCGKMLQELHLRFSSPVNRIKHVSLWKFFCSKLNLPSLNVLFLSLFFLVFIVMCVEYGNKIPGDKLQNTDITSCLLVFSIWSHPLMIELWNSLGFPAC